MTGDASTPPAQAPPALPAVAAAGALARAVGCALEPRGLDAGSARYALHVRNGTAETLTATVRGVRRDGTLAAPPFVVAVEAGDDLELEVALPLAGGPYARVLADLRGAGLQIVVDAVPPLPGLRAPRDRRATGAVAAAFVAAVLAVAGAVGALLARPHVAALALVPDDGLVVARYATRGAGAVEYGVLDAHGAIVAGGPLPAAAGTIPLAGGTGAHAVRVTIRGPFGTDERVATLVEPPAPPPVVRRAPPRPRIDALAVAGGAPGEPTRIRYAVIGDRFAFAMIAPDGSTWARIDAAPGRGVATLPAAPGPGYLVVARATIGSAAAQTELALPAAPRPAPVVAPTIGPAVAGSDGLVMRPGLLTPGDPFVVTLPVADGAHVAVVRDRDGAELRAIDVGPGQRVVALVAPDRPEPATLHVTIARGVASETLLRPLRWLAK